MCGRFANNEKIEAQSAQFQADPRDTKWSPSANCAPSQQLPIIFNFHDQRYLRLAEWGFQPAWAKGKSIINAQSETAATKASFREAFHKRRCIVPANAFFEWRKTDSGKQPVIFQCEDQACFAMAGIWESVETEQGRLGRFCVLTTKANPRLTEIHPRMPVILLPDEIDAWLDNNISRDRIQDFCRSYREDRSSIKDMDPAINNVRNNDPDLLKPYLLG